MIMTDKLRRSLEDEFEGLCSTISSSSSLHFLLKSRVEDARDRISALSKNDTKLFDDFLEAVDAYNQVRDALGSYIWSLRTSMMTGGYDKEKEIYKIQADQA